MLYLIYEGAIPLMLPDKYIADLLVRMSHYSNAIENNTITLPETVSIIVHSVIPNNVSLREFYEIDNHQYAMEYVLSANILEEKFSIDTLLKMHEILMDKLHHEKGSLNHNIMLF